MNTSFVQEITPYFELKSTRKGLVIRFPTPVQAPLYPIKPNQTRHKLNKDDIIHKSEAMKR